MYKLYINNLQIVMRRKTVNLRVYRNSMASVKIDKHFGAKCFGKKSMDYQKFYTRLGIGNHMTKPFA